MYAETFKVRPWLEEPAKWLRWAMQSLGARNLQDTTWNLQQFWKTVEPFKGKAASSQDWGELLTLDSQSQLTLGNLYGAQASELLQSMNTTKLVSSIAYSMKEAGYKAELARLQSSRDRAFEASRTLASQAADAFRKANVTDHQAANTAKVAGGATARAKDDAKQEGRDLATIQSGVPFWSMDFLGAPMWVWIAGGVVLALALTAGPSAVTIMEALPSNRKKATA